MRMPSVGDVVRPLVLAGLGFMAGNLGTQLVMGALSGAYGTQLPALPDFLTSAVAANPPAGVSLAREPLAMGGVLGGIGLLRSVFGGGRDVSHDIRPEEQTGSNRLATPEEYARYRHAKDTREWPKPSWCARVEDDNLLLGKDAVIGYSDNPDRSVNPKNRHTFVMAGSGAGKTFNFLTSNVMQLNSSFVFSDPKGEIFARFAEFLRLHGYVVKVVDLRSEGSILDSDGVDPFHYCHDMTAIANVVDTFIENTSSPEATEAGNSKFFTDMERALYKAVYGLMFFWFAKNGRPEDFNMPSALDYLELLKNEGDQAQSRLDLVFLGTRKKDRFVGYKQYLLDNVMPRVGGTEEALRDAPEWEPIVMYNTVKSAAGSPEEMAGVISSCFNRLQPFANHAVRTLFKRDELELDRIGARRQALFLCIADTGGPYDFIASLLVSILFKVNVFRADSLPTHHLEIPVTCYLDELANIGKLPNLSEAFNTFRSRWINLVAITQYSDQLKKVYKEGARGVRAASMIFVYLGSGDWDTCKQLSEEIGEHTVRYEDRSRQVSQSGTTYTYSEHWVKQPIFSASELNTMGLDADECLVKINPGGWIKTTKPNPMEHPRWAELKRAGEVDLASWREARRAERRAKDRRLLPEGGETGGSHPAENPNLVVYDAGS